MTQTCRFDNPKRLLEQLDKDLSLLAREIDAEYGEVWPYGIWAIWQSIEVTRSYINPVEKINA